MFAAEVRHIENWYVQSKMLNERSWGSRTALFDSLILSLGFGMLIAGHNKKYFDGSFIHYAEKIRNENQS